MGRKGNWFSSIKKTLSPISKEKKAQRLEKRLGFTEEQSSVPSPNPSPAIVGTASGCFDCHPTPPPQEVNPLEMEADPPQPATATAGGPATAAAVVMGRYSGMSREEVAAVRIQTVFRGYLARRALWGLRGLVRLKTVIEGSNVKRQTVNTLKCTQRLFNLQSQISYRRIRMSEENQALQKQLLRDKEMADMQNGDEWNDSVQSKEEIEAKLLGRYEAAMRRERAMAYSFSRQQPWKKSGGTTNMLFMDPTNPQWGWSWSERYKDPENNHASVTSNRVNITKTEIAKSYACRQLNSALSTPRSKGSVASRKPVNPAPSPRAFGSGLEGNPDDDSKSVKTGYRRRSVTGVKSAKVAENGGGSTVGSGGGGGVKKRAVKPRRHSEPPKAETGGCKEPENGGG